MIGFRVDSNSEIGTGHLMRCLAVAEKLREGGCQVCFITKNNTNIEKIEKENYPYFLLEGEYTKLEEEIDVLTNLLKEKEIEVLVVDSYFVTNKYLKAVRQVSKTVYFDDLHEMIYPCDTLINYAVYAKSTDYQKLYENENTSLLLGCDYTPLRAEFQIKEEHKIRENVQKILILSGGTDQYHFIIRFVKEIAMRKEFKDIEFHTVCGRFNTDKECVKEMAKGYENIFVYENLTQLRNFMKEADIAISASGITLYELAACGTPTIGYLLADNQKDNLKTFATEGYIESVGDIREAFPAEELLKKLEILKDANVRCEMSRRMRKLVDGKGCSRLAAEIRKLQEKTDR